MLLPTFVDTWLRSHEQAAAVRAPNLGCAHLGAAVCVLAAQLHGEHAREFVGSARDGWDKVVEEVRYRGDEEKSDKDETVARR
ncbi:hypothetical protein ACEQ8H_002449 [Pleosporales sp. CAS-2024a]